MTTSHEKPTFFFYQQSCSRLLNGLKALSVTAFKSLSAPVFLHINDDKIMLKKTVWHSRKRVKTISSRERVAQKRMQKHPRFWKRCERRQFILIRAPTPKALRLPVAPLCHPSTPPYFIHKHSPSNTNKRTLLSRIFIKSWGCGWLLFPSETNHLIKKKWADRIDEGRFQRGGTPLPRQQQQPVNKDATGLQTNGIWWIT